MERKFENIFSNINKYIHLPNKFLNRKIATKIILVLFFNELISFFFYFFYLFIYFRLSKKKKQFVISYVVFLFFLVLLSVFAVQVIHRQYILLVYMHLSLFTCKLAIGLRFFSLSFFIIYMPRHGSK
jgi:hypothetical protein